MRINTRWKFSKKGGVCNREGQRIHMLGVSLHIQWKDEQIYQKYREERRYRNEAYMESGGKNIEKLFWQTDNDV